MVLRLDHTPEIETLREYPRDTLEELRRLLASGGLAKPDPRRKDFYELEDHSRVFYIHVSPVTGKVLLLGIWQKDPETASQAASSPRAA